MNIDIANSATWPLRMKRQEVGAVMRWSERTLRKKVALGLFPPSDDGITWGRDVVENYARGGIREFVRRSKLRVVRKGARP